MVSGLVMRPAGVFFFELWSNLLKIMWCFFPPKYPKIWFLIIRRRKVSEVKHWLSASHFEIFMSLKASSLKSSFGVARLYVVLSQNF